MASSSPTSAKHLAITAAVAAVTVLVLKRTGAL